MARRLDRGCHTNDPDLADSLDSERVKAVRLTDEDDVEIGDVRVDRHQIVA